MFALWWIPALLITAGSAARARDHGPEGALIPWIALGLTTVALIPAMLRSLTVVRGGTPRGPIPFLPLVGVVYAIYYALPVLATDDPTFMYRQIGAEHLQRAVQLAFAGVVCMLIGYYVVGRCLRIGRRIDLRWDPRRAVVAAIVLARGCLAG